MYRTNGRWLGRPGAQKQEVFDLDLQVLVCWHPDRVLDGTCLQGVVDLRFREGRVGADRHPPALGGYCQVDENLVDRPPRCWARARREPAMLGIRNGRQPQLDNTVDALGLQRVALQVQ